MSFLDELAKNTNDTLTENSAKTNLSTLDPLLDFFSRAGAMRGRETEAIELFKKAYAKDKESAIRCLFYIRDVRGGQGERSVFRSVLRWLDKETIDKITHFIPEYGRWDDLPFNHARAVEFIKNQLVIDKKSMNDGKSVSLVAKWLPSINTTSDETRKLADELMKQLNLKPRQYRKMLAELRRSMNLLEHMMTENRWSEIDYSKIPSQAHKKHVKAFLRHDEERYRAFLGSVKKGEKKINVGTLYTYQLYDMVKNTNNVDTIDAANTMWGALPDYTHGTNALVLADVSGSMSGLHWGHAREIEPMSIAVSLALYFAERNEGPFKDHFLTFTTNSRLQRINGENLKERMESIEYADWHGSTNIQSAFDAILNAAQASGVSADDVPRIVYVISDMEFDRASPQNTETNFQAMERKFKDAGYELPHVVFWNVDARGNQSPATKYDNRVTLISGSSQSTFKYAVEGKTPMEFMLEVLNSERYKQITI